MAGIPEKLLNQLRQVLLECEQFDSDDKLRAIFVCETLTPWRFTLPQADSLTSRVDSLISFLVDKRRSDTKENALALFVRLLSKQINKADERHQQLAYLALELERSFVSGTTTQNDKQNINTGINTKIDSYAQVNQKLQEQEKNPPCIPQKLEYRLEDQAWYAPNLPVTQEIDENECEPFKNNINVVIITATDVELKAVTKLLKPYPNREKVLLLYSGPETYYLGNFGAYSTVVTKCRMGAIGEGSVILATEQAQRLWCPKAIIMLGIAFGKDSNKQKIGDVLVASQIISYEQERIGVGDEIIPRGSIPPSNTTLLNRFENTQNWQFARPDGLYCDLIIGPVLSGEKLVDNPDFKASLFKKFPQAVGGEMEGAGLCAALGRVGAAWILVKSICDWADGEKDKKHQALAAAVAANLVHHVLSQKTVLNGIKKCCDGNYSPPSPPSSSKQNQVDSHTQGNKNSQQPEHNRLCAVILTAIPVEYKAVRAYLTELREELHPQGTIYEKGKFVANGTVWDVVIVEIGAGNTVAATEAKQAIDHFKPNVIFFVGVAGGIKKDVSLGDVVAATKVYGYESGKAKIAFEPRPDVGLSTYKLIQRARAEAKKEDWLQRLKPNIPESAPNTLVAPIAAGEKVIASKRSSLFKFLQSNYGDAVAVEMEGRGLLQAAHANQPVSALIIRGISDLISGKSNTDKAGWQEIAARHASAFAFQILAKLEIDKNGNKQVKEFQDQLDILHAKKDHYTDELIKAGSQVKQIENSLADVKKLVQHAILPRFKRALNWIENSQKQLAENSVEKVLKNFSTFKEMIENTDLSEDSKEDFCWVIEKYLERLHLSLYTNKREPLYNPSTPRSLPVQAYVEALKYIQHMVPEDIDSEAPELISNLQYLIERLMLYI